MMRAAALGLPAGGSRNPALLIGGALVVITVAIGEVILLARGGMMGLVVLGGVAILVGALLFADHVFEVLLVWVAIEAVAFPFLRFPHYSAAYVTLDRFVVLALGGALLVHRAQRMSTRTRQLTIAFGLFTIAYGIRAFTTDQLLLPTGRTAVSSIQPEADWLDNALLPFIVFLVAARTVTADRWPTLAKALAACGAAAGAVAILQWVFGFELATLTGQDAFVDGTAGVVRAGGPFPQPTALGSVMVICIAATLYWLQTERAYALAGSALGLEVLGLLPGVTKTVWAAAFVALLLGYGVRRRVSSRTALVAIYGVTTVALVYFFVRSSPVVAARVTSTDAQDNFLGRLATWKQALYMFDGYTISGVGIEQFASGQLLVGQPTVGGVLPVPTAHNTFLGVLGETGLLGTIPLLLVLFASVRIVRACKKLAVTHADDVFRAVLLGAMVGSFFLSMTFSELYEPPAFMFVALLLGVAAARVDHMTRRQKARPPRSQSLLQAGGEPPHEHLRWAP